MTIQILSILSFVAWPIIMFFYMWLFPNWSLAGKVLGIIAIFYPMFILIGFQFFGVDFFHLKPMTLIWVSGVCITLSVCVFRYPRMILNSYRNVPETGVFINEKAVYFYGEKMDEADPKTFKVLGESSINQYSIDQNHVYFGKRVLAGADAATFVKVSGVQGDYYWKDSKAVYFDGRVIPGADAMTFESVPKVGATDAVDAKDKNQQYSFGKKK